MSTRRIDAYNHLGSDAVSSVAPRTARRTHLSAETIHGMIYFSPFARESYSKLGITDQRMGYFASRSAALGAVPAEVTIATFFNFHPEAVRRVIPAAWEVASPAAILEARMEGADRTLRKAWGQSYDSGEVREAATLARRAAERAAGRPQGRPLFAAHASLAWPEEAHLVLWHSQTLLREYRGDGHVSLLLCEGLDGAEALVVHAATGEVAGSTLKTMREWSDAEWADAVARVRARGWLEDGDDLALSAAGREHRRGVEDRTDLLGAYPYEALGEEGCARLAELAIPLSKAIVDGDVGFPPALAGRLAKLV
jgi:hypothetical protein